MAKAGRLSPFSDLFLIGDYAEKFGLDPDFVYSNVGFRGLINFTVAYKERDEFNERFTDIWSQLNDTGIRTGTDQNSGA